MRIVFCHQEADSTGDSLRAAIEGSCEIVDWHAHAGEAAPSLTDVGAVVALGGLTNPDDGEAWLEGERAFLRDAVEHGLGVLAICLGAQLLAQSLGGSAFRLERPEIGFYDARPTDEGRADALIAPLGSPFPAFEWHDYGFDPPPRSVLLATTDSWHNQAFRCGERAWGLQYHIEVDRCRTRYWLSAGADNARARGFSPDALRERAELEADAYERGARALMQRFVEASR